MTQTLHQKESSNRSWVNSYRQHGILDLPQSKLIFSKELKGSFIQVPSTILSMLPHFNTLRPILRYILVAAIIFIVSIDFWLINIPEMFSGGYKIGQLIYKLSLAYITSLLFYYINIHIKSQQDKNLLRPHVRKNCVRIIGNYNWIASSLASETKIERLKSLQPIEFTERDIIEISGTVDPNNNSRFIVDPTDHPQAPSNWTEFFVYSNAKSIQEINFLLSLPNLDASLINILLNIQSCSWFSMVNHLSFLGHGNYEFHRIALSLSIYRNLIKELNEYMELKISNRK